MNQLLGLLMVIFSVSFAAADSKLDNYYGSDFLNQYSKNQLNNQTLVDQLFKVISNSHKPIPYESAKDVMFGRLFLEETANGYEITDVYCERKFTDADFGMGKVIGPMRSPTTGDVLNTEHTWPQSHFTNSFPKETQKADLHHLFPTDSKMNNERANYDFGNVISPKPGLKCPIAKLGSSGKNYVFEVPMKQRGNSARAIFYFSVRYKLLMPAAQEIALRGWAVQDPIDQQEIDQNDIIQQVQGNRNPFIDMPDLLNHISAFSVQKK